MEDREACVYKRSLLRRGYIRYSLANILHISNITILRVSVVSNNLGTPIWKLYTVLAFNTLELVPS